MNEQDVMALLRACVQDAENDARAADPVRALAARRERRAAQRGQIAVLAFVLFVLGVQLMPSDAFGEQGHLPATVALSCSNGPSGQDAARAGRCR